MAAFLCGEGGAAVRHVNATSAGSQDAGEADADHPYRTLSYAMKRLRPGDTLNIAGGVYQEALQFPQLDWARGPTVIQTEGGGEVLIKDSDGVSGWIPAERGLYVNQIVIKDKAELRPRANRLIGNILAWNGKAAIVLPAVLPDANRSSPGRHR